MNKYLLKGLNGLYFVKGQGFAACSKAKATVLDESELKCVSSLGFVGTTEKATLSYGVVYIRKGDGQRLLAGGTKAPASASAGQLDPSKRRFADRDEAIQHGSRFDKRRKDRGDKPGSAEHEGFFVVETSDPVNAKINWKTGLTNPV